MNEQDHFDPGHASQGEMSEQERLETAIAALEGQRALLGDTVIDAALAPLREKLDALQARADDQQRKYVTVLFADLWGFTSLSEGLDPEEVNEMMNAVWRQLDQAILDSGGWIDKHMGDGVMAVWGSETAREDDPEQAVRAALTMQAILHDAGQGKLPLPAFFSIPLSALQMRIGVHTGPVLLSDVGTTGEYTAIGDTVEIAIRLEEAAPRGGILVSAGTCRHIKGLFELSPYRVLPVPGRVDPLQVYRVIAARPRAFWIEARGVEGVQTHMVGREAELQRLKDTLLTVQEEGELQMVTISGEAGVGKTRLLYELNRWTDTFPEHVPYLTGRTNTEMQGQAYSLLRNLITQAFAIQESDQAGEVRAKLEGGVTRVFQTVGRSAGQAQIAAHFIGLLIGFDFSDSPHLRGVLGDARLLRDQALSYLGDYFVSVTESFPVLLVMLEDIHWADDSSLDAIQQVVGATTEANVLILCSTRPELFERRPYWGEGLSFHTHLKLGPLSLSDSRRLLDEILQKVDEVPAELRDRVVSQAEGNPYYLEELVKMLIEDGVIVKEGERWRAADIRLEGLTVPPTLTGVLQARLDRLTAGQRSVLQRAAVIGRLFWDETIDYLASPEAQHREASAPIREALAALRLDEMIFRREGSAFAGTNEYIFKQALLRDVAYESLLKRKRRIYHARVAEWLALHSGERVGEWAGAIAGHLELAGEPAQAARYLCQAATQAAGRFANNEALAYLNRALALAPARDDPLLYEIFMQRQKIYDTLGERKAQWGDLAALEEIASRLGDLQKMADVALAQAHYYEMTSDWAAALDAAEQAAGWAAKAQDAGREAAAHLQEGRVLMSLGSLDEAQQRLDQGGRLADKAGQPNLQAEVLRSLGALSAESDLLRARRYFEEALAIYRRIGNRRGEAGTLTNLGLINNSLGDALAARGYLERSLGLRREAGDRRGESVCLQNLGVLTLDTGDFVQASAYFQNSLAIYRQVGDRDGEEGALLNLGLASCHMGDFENAGPYFQQALDLARAIHHRGGETLALAYLGLLNGHQQNLESAFAFVQQALQIDLEMEERRILAIVWNQLGNILAAQKQTSRARYAYEQSLEIRRDLHLRNLALEPLAGLAQLALSDGDLPQAHKYVEEILTHLYGLPEPESGLSGVLEPARVYLACIRVLRAAADERAGRVYQDAQAWLDTRARRIPDPSLRRSFLENLPAHRELYSLSE